MSCCVTLSRASRHQTLRHSVTPPHNTTQQRDFPFPFIITANLCRSRGAPPDLGQYPAATVNIIQKSTEKYSRTMSLAPFSSLSFELTPLENVRQESFIIGVDPPYERDGLEAVLEAILGEDFFERNKFRLFLAVVIIIVCLLFSCCIFFLRKTCGKCPASKERRSFRQISVSDKMLESGLQQETFQFMPLKALSPLDMDTSYLDQDLPDYEQLQLRRIDPNKLSSY